MALGRATLATLSTPERRQCLSVHLSRCEWERVRRDVECMRVSEGGEAAQPCARAGVRARYAHVSPRGRHVVLIRVLSDSPRAS